MLQPAGESNFILDVQLLFLTSLCLTSSTHIFLFLSLDILPLPLLSPQKKAMPSLRITGEFREGYETEESVPVEQIQSWLWFPSSSRCWIISAVVPKSWVHTTLHCVSGWSKLIPAWHSAVAAISFPSYSVCRSAKTPTLASATLHICRKTHKNTQYQVTDVV